MVIISVAIKYLWDFVWYLIWLIDLEDNKLTTRNGARDCVIFVADIFEQLNFRVQIYENYYNYNYNKVVYICW